MTAAPVLVRALRGGFAESEHRGIICSVRADGQPFLSCGDVSTLAALRSSAKPFQLIVAVASGAADRFGFSDEELAVMAGSHGGTPAHVAAVASALSKVGLAPDHLQCGVHAPFDAAAAEALVKSGGKPDVRQNNCSGKHTAMLAAARQLSAPLDTYLDPDHPVQRRIRDDLAFAAGVRPEDVVTAVDGCSAPTFFLTMAGAARAFARLASADEKAADPREAALGRIRRVMTAHPVMVAGPGRFDTALMEADLSIAAKGGAESFQGLALRGADGPIGVAIKIADGGARAVGPAALEALVQLGRWPTGVPEALRKRHRPPLTNHRGTVVGSLEPAFELRPR